MVLRDPSLKRVRPGGSVFAALIGLNQPPSSPLAGLTCTVTVTLARAANVLIVPRRAIVMLDGRPHVAVRSSDCVRATAVVLGLSNEEFVEVTKGLEGDARIALGTEAELRDAITGR
jgi:hypothetical protein